MEVIEALREFVHTKDRAVCNQRAIGRIMAFIPSDDARQKVMREIVVEELIRAELRGLRLQGDHVPNLKVSRNGVVVDQNYFWNLDMAACGVGKVQLIGKGGLPTYGFKHDAPNFYIGWAPVPKMPT